MQWKEGSKLGAADWHGGIKSNNSIPLLPDLEVATQSTYCMKSVQIRSFVWSVFSRIQSECGKIRTKKNSVFGHFFRCDECLISTYLGRFDGEVFQECHKLNMTII